MNSLRPILELLRVRLILFTREPEAIFWVFLFPVVLALVLSFAFKQRGVETVRVGVVDVMSPAGHPPGLTFPEWTTALEADESIEVVRFEDLEAAERKLRAGAVAALVLGGWPQAPDALSPTFGLTVRCDPTRPEGEMARLRVTDVIERRAGRVDVVQVQVDAVTEHGSRYIDFLIPGLLGMNLMGTGIWGTGFSIVDWRQKKLLKRLMVTPMRKTEYLLSQVFSRFIFLVLEVLIISVFGVLVLGVPFRGSVLAFAAVCVLGTLCFSGLGLLIAARPQTIEGVSGIMNFVMMPMWLFSGVFFSYENFPGVFHPAIRLLPLTALNDALRNLMLEGGSPGLPIQMAVMAAWGLLSFFLAMRFFRWQ